MPSSKQTLDSPMPRSITRLVILIVTGLLSGCAHNLTVMAADGTMGTGRATGFAGKGTLEVQIGSQTYTGTWVSTRGGSVGFGMVGRHSFSTATLDDEATGNALLRASDGSTMQCRFIYSGGGLSGTGYGECIGSDGTHYDFQIT
jgi:hypothetical protein